MEWRTVATPPKWRHSPTQALQGLHIFFSAHLPRLLPLFPVGKESTHLSPIIIVYGDLSATGALPGHPSLDKIYKGTQAQ